MARVTKTTAMRISFRLVALVVAVILFLVAAFVDEDNWSDLVALGLAVFAAAFLVDELRLDDRVRGAGRGTP